MRLVCRILRDRRRFDSFDFKDEYSETGSSLTSSESYIMEDLCMSTEDHGYAG